MSYIGCKGYSIFKTEIESSKIKQIKKDLTMKPFSNNPYQPPKQFSILCESVRKFYLPRYYAVNLFGDTQNIIKKGIDINLEFKGELRDYQKNIVNKYLDHVKESGGGLLDVEPGKGKTVMALDIISKLKKKTLVVVHKSFLTSQWMERIQTFLPEAKIGKIQGTIFDIEGKDIVIGMIQTLSMKYYDTSIWEQFGLTIYDECHHLSAETFSNVMRQIVTNYTLGLSGTMTRKDGLSKLFKYYLGEVVHKEKSEEIVDVMVKTIKLHNESDFESMKPDMKGNYNYSSLVNKLNTPERSDLISKIIQKELSIIPDQQIMILGHTKSMLQQLHNEIKKFEPSVGYYLGGMKENDLKKTESCKIIIATYSMASEGLDIKTLTTLILASPKSDVCQSIGRILRMKHQRPLVIDFIDEHSMFQSQYNKRIKYYKSKKYSIHTYESTLDYFKKE